MKSHFDYGLRLETETEFKSLYGWAIHEIDADGHSIGGAQIPWKWRLYFSATSCLLIDELEIGNFSKKEKEADDAIIDQFIIITLQPDDAVMFSMFGTNRAVKNFTLEVRCLADGTKSEFCAARGKFSSTYEIDFVDVTDGDTLCFFLDVKTETFSKYVDLIRRSSIDDIKFFVGSVDGFYSEWCGGLRTDIKILLRDHDLNVPTDFQGVPPRLGKVGEARLRVDRRLELSKSSPPPVSIDERAEAEPPAANRAGEARDGASREFDPRFLPLLGSLKEAAWCAVALLAAIAVKVWK
jgi:hypothetical protein